MNGWNAHKTGFCGGEYATNDFHHYKGSTQMEMKQIGDHCFAVVVAANPRLQQKRS
jgi:hypothetical protein